MLVSIESWEIELTHEFAFKKSNCRLQLKTALTFDKRDYFSIRSNSA